MQALASFEQTMQNNPRAPIQPLLETRHALEKLISRMDGLESSFDRIVERARERSKPKFKYLYLMMVYI